MHIVIEATQPFEPGPDERPGTPQPVPNPANPPSPNAPIPEMPERKQYPIHPDIPVQPVHEPTE